YEEEEASEEDKKGEEHLAPIEFTTLLAIDPVPSAEDTKAFETDKTRKTVRLSPPMAASLEALIVEFASAPTPPSPPPSLLSSWSSPLLQIPSPPLPSDIPETDMPFWKRLCLTALDSRFEVGESLPAAARHAGRALTSSVDYEFIDTMDASIRACESRVIIGVEEVNERVTDLATTQRYETHELYVRH
nr:hypothetical protein [Tanacetum cinerariifolium]